MKREGTYTVWVGGAEVVNHLVCKETALRIKQSWTDNGYDDVKVVNLALNFEEEVNCE
jgi:hypothetical protein